MLHKCMFCESWAKRCTNTDNITRHHVVCIVNYRQQQNWCDEMLDISVTAGRTSESAAVCSR